MKNTQQNLIPNIYISPLGLPLYWGNEQSKKLPRAVIKYFGQQPLNQSELELLINYCRYYINAPCWQNKPFETKLQDLRKEATALTTVEEISEWINNCLNIGIDPF